MDIISQIKIRNLTQNLNGTETEVTISDLVKLLTLDLGKECTRLEYTNSKHDLKEVKLALNRFRKLFNEFDQRIRVRITEEIILHNSIDNEDKREQIIKYLDQKRKEHIAKTKKRLE